MTTPKKDRREYQRLWRAANPKAREANRENWRKWYAANPEKVRAHWAKTNTPEMYAYMNARRRCNNPRARGYEYYGGRGIKVLFTSFKQFLAEVGPRPSPKHSLDRINNDGHYEPGNVRWATKSEQSRNQRPRRRRIEAVGAP